MSREMVVQNDWRENQKKKKKSQFRTVGCWPRWVSSAPGEKKKRKEGNPHSKATHATTKRVQGLEMNCWGYHQKTNST